MQMVIDVAGFTPADADQLRQAMGSKRSSRRMAALRERFDLGTAANGITADVSEAIWAKLAAFANYGFPESHSVSFAYLVYSSSWIKLHYPAAFCAALLKSQPMGFYSPQTLVQDARRHGVKVHTPDLNRSDWCATLEAPSDSHDVSSGGPAVRLGLSSVRKIGDDLAKRIAAGRPYSGMEDLVRRCGLNRSQMEALATSGAFGCFGTDNRGVDDSGVGGSEGDRSMDRRRAIWSAGAATQAGPGRLPGVVVGMEAPQLPGMDDWEEAVADLWATGVSPEGHPTRFLRSDLDRRGVVTASEMRERSDRSKVVVAGVVTHRQRPPTATGVTFLSIEDETGLINVIVSRGCWMRYRNIVGTAPALLINGRLEKTSDGVVNVHAEKIQLLPVVASTPSRDFR